jgi:hypothetical protein
MMPGNPVGLIAIGLVPLAHVHQHLWLDPNRIESAAVVSKRGFVLGAAVHEFEEQTWQPLARQLTQVLDVLCAVQVHEGSRASGSAISAAMANLTTLMPLAFSEAH